MTFEPPRTRGGTGLAALLASLDQRLDNESEVLGGFLLAMMRGQLPPEAWEKLNAAAQRDDRLAELAFAFEELSQDRRLKTLAPSAVAEFMFRAATFLGDVFGDDVGRVTYLEKALAAVPGHGPSMEKLEAVLAADGNTRRRAELYADTAAHKPRAEQAVWYRKAAALFAEVGVDDKAIECWQVVVRLEPSDEAARNDLAAALERAGRTRDLAKVLEASLGGDAQDETATRATRLRLLRIYDGANEPERALGHAEAVLATDPANAEAIAIATRLLENKGAAARAAAALAVAHQATGNMAEVARLLGVELEHTRGPKRLGVLKKLGALRQDALGDAAGALEVLEAALALDASDEEIRRRYVKAVRTLGRQADAVKTFQRLSAVARDPVLRARLTIDMGEMMLASGDAKRARAVLTSVLAMPGIDDDNVVAASLALAEIHEAEGDIASLADMLERVVQRDPVEQRRWAACERLAELAAGALADPARAIVAWRGLLRSPLRQKALDNLEKLLASVGDGVGLAEVLLEKSKDESDPSAAQALMARAADELCETSGQVTRASEILQDIVERYGPTREVLARWKPLLELEGDWTRLERLLQMEVNLASHEERAGVLATLGLHRLQRRRDPGAALEAFSASLAIEPSDATSRVTLEQLLASEDETIALRAAGILEPIYRAEASRGGLMRVLAARAARASNQQERLGAIREALGLAQTLPNEQPRALDLLRRGITEVLEMGEPVLPWLDQLRKLVPDDDTRRGEVLFRVMGAKAADPKSAFLIARAAGDALVQADDIERALVAYRRALELSPGSPDLVAIVDDLLQRSGTPEDRFALYRNALEREPDRGTRRRLLSSMAELQRRELADAQGAINTLRVALEEDPEDRAASDTLLELFEETEQWEQAAKLLEARLALDPAGADANALHARLAELHAKLGDATAANAHCRPLLDAPAPSLGDLDLALRVAERLGDATLTSEVLGRRANAATAPDDRVFWLSRLGAVQADGGDSGGAAATFKSAARAADEAGDTNHARTLYERVRKLTPYDPDATSRLVAIAEDANDDAALPTLYVDLAECAKTEDERYAALTKLAVVLERGGDAAGALDAAARAFAVRPADPGALDQLEKYARRAGDLDAFVRALDAATSRTMRGEPDEAGTIARLSRARARAVGEDPARRKDAWAALEALVADDELPEAERHGAAADLDAMLPGDAIDERRRLFGWRAEHALGDELGGVLERWAAFEEAQGTPEQALAAWKRLAQHQPDHPGATTAAARLMLAAGDVDGALASLKKSVDGATGDAKRTLELQVAGILVDAGRGVDEVSALLEERADGPALALAAKLLRSEGTRDAIAAVIQRALDSATDPTARAHVLDALVRDAVGAPAEARVRWHEELLGLRADAPGDERYLMLQRALREAPERGEWWDEAEALARDRNEPAPLAQVFDAALAAKPTPEVAEAVGNRAVAFHEEWFEDTAGVARILERLLEIDPTSSWAFDRLKLLYDAAERWEELFVAYDRVIGAAEGTRKVDLLEDAAQVAKDFANHSERAIGYLEQLLALKPANARLVASLERLYERHERYRPLIELLSQRLPGLAAADALKLRGRIASIWLDQLHDAGSALLVVEEMLGDESAEAATTAEALLQRVLAAAQPTEEVRKTLPPPPEDSLVPPALASAPPPRASVPPPRASVPPPAGGRGRGKRVLVRQRAAAILKERYAAAGRDADLVKVLEVELEHVKNAKERIRRHREIADLYVKLGQDPAALEHCVSLVLLEPDVASHREKLVELAERVGRWDRLAEVLATAADDCAEDALRVELLMQAAEVQAKRLADLPRAADLYGRVLSLDSAPEATLAAARELDALLVEMGRAHERLPVLERIAQLETVTAARRAAFSTIARIAADAGEIDRALGAWHSQLELDPDDREALDGTVSILEAAHRPRELVEVLRLRAGAAEREGDTGRAQSRADRVRVARILSNELGDGAQAIDVWRAIEDDFGESDEGTFSLATLFSDAERWSDLAELLSRAAKRAQATERKAALLRRLGDIQHEHLQAAPEAVKSYEAALAADPNDEGSLAGLLALLAQPPVAAGALKVLLEAYRRTDSWRPVLELTDARLKFAEGDTERVTVLLEVAELAEKRANDVAAAFDATRKAFGIARGDELIAEELVRLATMTGSWRALADAHRSAIDGAETGTWRDADHLARLRMRLGGVLETHLDDPRGALAAYARVASDTPTDENAAIAAIRVAGRVARWDVAAKVVVDHAVASSSVGEKLALSLEDAASGPAAWDAVTGAFAAAIAERADLAPLLARDLEARLATWHLDRRGDPDAAEAAYARALAHDPQSTDILRRLAELQRRSKGRPLIESLLRLSQTTGGDLDLLREAAEVATTVVADRGLAKTIVERLFKLGVERWTGSHDPPLSGAVQPPSSYVEWALAELIRIHNEEGNAERIVELLVEASRLPFEAERSRAMRHEAARVAVDRVGDLEGALSLYFELFEDEPTDRDAASMLAKLYAQLGRNAQLLGLRRRQVEIATEVEERLALRLEIARLERGLGHQDAAIAELRANLAEVPREPETRQTLAAVLEELGKHAELVALCTEQAQLAEKDGDHAAAADLWARAAELAERELADPATAIAHHRRVVRIELRPTSLDVLARLLEVAGDHEAAADYLDRLAQVTQENRTPIIARLADALVAAERHDAARARLEESLSNDPGAAELSDRLAKIYRRAHEWAPLADLLARAAEYAPTPEIKLERLREAAELRVGPCQAPDAAIPLLEAASALAPDDRRLKLALADALGAAGRIDDARALLKRLIEGFGARRPKERAQVHFHLARLDLATNDRAQALVELEAATRIDPANPEILRMIAELARDDGHLEKAERSYRALLSVVRKGDEGEPGALRSEVLVELADIATRQGESERAEEILESAFESAAASEAEARALEGALRAKKQHTPLVRAMQSRCARAGETPAAGEALAELAEVLEELGRNDEATDALLRAARLTSSASVHERARAAAIHANKTAEYAKVVETAAEAAEAAGDKRLASAVWLRRARLALDAEDPARDVAAGARYLERARASGSASLEVLRLLEGAYAELGDHAAQEKVLTELVEQEVETTSRDPRTAADALYRLAELRGKAGAVDASAQLVSTALDLAPDLERAQSIVDAGLARDAAAAPLFDLAERIARASKDDARLVRALLRKSDVAEEPLPALEEAARVAESIGDASLTEETLRRCETKARGRDDALARRCLLRLAELVEARGDRAETLRLTLEAAEISDPAEARAMRLAVAEAAQNELRDPALATSAYEHMLEVDPRDLGAALGLVAVHRQGDRPEALVAAIARALEVVEDEEQRIALRVERARLLAGPLGRVDEAVAELKDTLDSGPNRDDVATLLDELLTRQGKTEELKELLVRQLDAAKDRGDAAPVAALSMRLGSLLLAGHRQEARNVFVGGLDWEPANRGLLTALLALLDAPEDAAERAGVLERLLAITEGEAAEPLALELAASLADQWDSEGAERVLETGLRMYPESKEIRARLLSTYEERNDTAKLAALHETTAHGPDTIARLRDAARLYGELGRPADAARVLARLHAAGDAGALGALVEALSASGDAEAAARALGNAIDTAANPLVRAELLARRAPMRLEIGDVDGAVADMSEAFAADPAAHGAEYVALLDEAAKRATDHAAARALRLRLAELLAASGRIDDARAQLDAILSVDGNDREALRMLAKLDLATEEWRGAAMTLRRLVAFEDGEHLVATALSLADCAILAGAPDFARPGLERAHAEFPEDEHVASTLANVYERTGATPELMELELGRARRAPDAAARFELLQRLGSVLLQSDPDRAAIVLQEAYELQPGDAECGTLFAEALRQVGRDDDAVALLQGIIASHRGRRSKELAVVHHGLARIERARGDRGSEMAALSTALDMDGQNGAVASELADVALALGQFDVATKALRAVTMLKTPAPLPRAVAYQHLGEIAQAQGDTKRAVMLLKRAVDDDPTLERARTLLNELQSR